MIFFLMIPPNYKAIFTPKTNVYVFVLFPLVAGVFVLGHSTAIQNQSSAAGHRQV